MTEVEAKGRAGGGMLLMGVAIVVVAAVAAWAFLGGGESSDANSLPTDDAAGQLALGVIDSGGLEIGEPAPDFVLIDGRDAGKVIQLSDYRGTPVVLNWYATWCGPCRAEIPEFTAANAALGDSVVFLGINFRESAEAALGLLEEYDAKYPTVLDTDGSVFEHYNGIGLPTTYFIDADGIVVEGGSGIVTEAALVLGLANVGIEYQPVEDD